MAEEVPSKLVSLNPTMPVVLAFGNPLLDISVHLKDKEFLSKHGLEEDGEVELPCKRMKEILVYLRSEVTSDSNQRISAGGSAQNSMRILQWLFNNTLKKPCSIYCGGLGKDMKGKTIYNSVTLAGVDARFADISHTDLAFQAVIHLSRLHTNDTGPTSNQHSKERKIKKRAECRCCDVTNRYALHSYLPSGLCIALIHESSRSLVANIGAAGVYTLDDLKKSNLQFDTIKIIYIEGFFITHSFPVAEELIKIAEEQNIILAFNLSGLYIFKEHQEKICQIIGHANIVFGNAREMEALAQSLNITYDHVTDIPFLLNSIKSIIVNASSIANDDWLHNARIFVMTQGGSAPAITVWGKGQSVQVHPIKPKAPIVDTIGAGDALVAGFLAGILAQWKPLHCLEYGCKVASFIITRHGVTLPPSVPTDLLLYNANT